MTMTSNIDQLYNEGVGAAPISDDSAEGRAKKKLEKNLVRIAQFLDLLQEPDLISHLELICEWCDTRRPIIKRDLLSVHYRTAQQTLSSC